MRLAIVGDVHGNLPVLEAMPDELAQHDAEELLAAFKVLSDLRRFRILRSLTPDLNIARLLFQRHKILI